MSVFMSLIFRIEKKEQAVNQKGNKKKEKKKGLNFDYYKIDN